jgi:hypothetical protein
MPFPLIQLFCLSYAVMSAELRTYKVLIDTIEQIARERGIKPPHMEPCVRMYDAYRGFHPCAKLTPVE